MKRDVDIDDLGQRRIRLQIVQFLNRTARRIWHQPLLGQSPHHLAFEVGAGAVEVQDVVGIEHRNLRRLMGTTAKQALMD